MRARIVRWIFTMLAAMAGVTAVMQDDWSIWLRLVTLALALACAEIEGQVKVRQQITEVWDAIYPPKEASPRS